MDKLLVLLAGLVFAVSIVCIVQANQRAEAQHRARQRHERDKVHGWPRPHRSAEGMIVALLADSGPGHIVVGGRTLWLRDGETGARAGGWSKSWPPCWSSSTTWCRSRTRRWCTDP